LVERLVVAEKGGDERRRQSKPSAESEGSVTDAELLIGLARGERAALRTLFDQYAGQMLETARGVVLDHQLAEEVVQDLFLRWLKTAPKTATYERLGAFLFVATRNAASDWIAKEHTQRGLPPAAIEPTGPIVDGRAVGPISAAAPEETIHDLQRLLAQALATLSDDDQYLLELRYGQNLTAVECAAHLDVTNLPAIHKRLQRARDRLDTAIREQRALHSSVAITD
jgi:RNA polymerase sigma-70 factor, ECF subfamily